MVNLKFILKSQFINSWILEILDFQQNKIKADSYIPNEEDTLTVNSWFYFHLLKCYH